jgi:DNA-binding IclR family transcriptional regulator
MANGVRRRALAPPPVKSATRAIDVLELLADRPQAPTHGDVARALGMPKSSLSELLATLESRGYVTCEADRYRLGPALLALAGTLLGRMDVARIAQPHVASLMLRTGESAAIVVRQGAEVVVVCKENCDQPILYSLQERAALLSAGALPRVTAASITDPAVLRRELDEIAAGGLAWSREEMVAGIVAIGLPLFDATGRASAGLSVGVPTVRFDPPRARRLEAALREAAAEISAALGWRKDRRSSAA